MSGAPTEAPPALDEEALRLLARNAGAVTRGRHLFGNGCHACHGPSGQGGIGPNLRDDHWLRGSRMTDIVTTIARGNPQAGMPGWAEVFSPSDVNALGAYVATLGGGAPVKAAKAPQGKLAPINYPVHGRRMRAVGVP